MSNYAEIIKENLRRLYTLPSEDLVEKLPASRTDNGFTFSAFGESCRIEPGGVILRDKPETGPLGVIISLYALQTDTVSCQLTPFKAFRELPDSMPYVGAFASHAERILIDHIGKIELQAARVAQQFRGSQGAREDGGDFSIVLYPLPKIALNYIFYRADDEFPASAACLFSNNSATFLPTDALADTGEYTSKKIIDIL
jgi:hypothetical protein